MSTNQTTDNGESRHLTPPRGDRAAGRDFRQGRLSESTRKTFVAAFARDLKRVRATVRDEFRRFFKTEEERFEEEFGIKDTRARLHVFDERIAAAERAVKELQEQKKLIEREHREWTAKPGLADYLRHGFEPPAVNSYGTIIDHNRSYMGLPLTTLLELKVCARVRDAVDAGHPLITLNEVAEAVARELQICSSLGEAEAALQMFYALPFDRLGVRVTPRIEALGQSGRYQALLEAPERPAQLSSGGADSPE